MTDPLYDRIGRGYARHRRPDPRISEAIRSALGDARSVLNVGAGTGSYEPRDREVVAVEPSVAMIRQRPRGGAPAVQAVASALPFADRCFDAALAVLTIHHWPDRAAGLRELRRVARERVVLLSWDPGSSGFWIADYFPEILEIDRPIFPTIDELRAGLGEIEVVALPIPHDCSDGFLGAHWRRPERYLEPETRGAISTFSKLSDVGSGLARLRDDLDSGAWEERIGSRLPERELDLGYRLVVAER